MISMDGSVRLKEILQVLYLLNVKTAHDNLTRRTFHYVTSTEPWSQEEKGSRVYMTENKNISPKHTSA